MKILIVDDWKSRHSLIKGIFELGGKSALFTSKFSPSDTAESDLMLADVVFLDHDMCKAPEGSPCPNPIQNGSGQNMLDEGCGCPTGQDMVKKILDFSERTGKKPACVVHTANTSGGKKMAQALYDAGFPVAWSPVFTWENCIPSTIFRMWKI